MVEFYLQTQTFLQTEWKDLMLSAQQKVNSCLLQCGQVEQCENLCQEPLKSLQHFAESKETLYVTKGVEFCKSECWDSKNLSECSERCIKNYSVLYKDFKDSLTTRYNSTRFYNSNP